MPRKLPSSLEYISSVQVASSHTLKRANPVRLKSDPWSLKHVLTHGLHTNLQNVTHKEQLLFLSAALLKRYFSISHVIIYVRLVLCN